MPADLKIYDLQEIKTSLDVIIPLKICGQKDDSLWWEKSKIYCPSYRPTDMLYGDFNYAQ